MFEKINLVIVVDSSWMLDLKDPMRFDSHTHLAALHVSKLRFFCFWLTHAIIRAFCGSFLVCLKRWPFQRFFFDKEDFFVCCKMEALGKVLGKQIRSLLVEWGWLARKTI